MKISEALSLSQIPPQTVTDWILMIVDDSGWFKSLFGLDSVAFIIVYLLNYEQFLIEKTIFSLQRDIGADNIFVATLVYLLHL